MAKKMSARAARAEGAQRTRRELEAKSERLLSSLSELEVDSIVTVKQSLGVTETMGQWRFRVVYVGEKRAELTPYPNPLSDAFPIMALLARPIDKGWWTAEDQSVHLFYPRPSLPFTITADENAQSKES